MARDLQYPCTLQIVRFVGEKAYTHHEQVFESLARERMLTLLDSIRAGLPPGFGASLTDARGYNVRELVQS